MNRPTSPEDVQKVFDCYCKKILKNEAINIQKHYQRLNDVQVSFSELTPEQLAELATYDDYSTDYDLYKVMGYDVKIKNAKKQLEDKYRFNKMQAEMIVNMRISRFTKETMEDLEKEVEECKNKVDFYKQLISKSEL